MADEQLSHLQPAPGKTAFDYGMMMAKVGAMAFPFLGTGVALFDVLTGPARSKRFSEWCEELRLRMNDLSGKVDGLTPEALATNEAFISALAQATQAAIRTHQQEKLDALRNAVLNVASGSAPKEYLQSIFLNLVDSFTVEHLLLLAYFEAGRAIPILEAPEWMKSGVASQLAIEIYDRGLLEHKPSILGQAGKYSFHTQPSSLGNQFLRFIRDPR